MMWSNSKNVFVSALAVLLWLGVSQDANAQDKDPSPELLKAHGKELLRAGKLKEAAGVFHQGFVLADGDLERVLAKNAAIVYLSLKQYEQAYYFLSYYLELVSGSPALTGKARVSIGEVEQELAGTVRFTVTVATPGALVCIDDSDCSYPLKPPVNWLVSPGRVGLVVFADGMKRLDDHVVIKPGSPETLNVTLEPLTPVVKAPPVEVAPAESNASVWPWVTLGSGAALAVAGISLEVTALVRNSNLGDDYQGQVDSGQLSYALATEQMDREFNSEVRPLHVAGLAMAATGAALVTGGILWLVLEKGATEERQSLRFGPLVTSEVTGIWLDVEF